MSEQIDPKLLARLEEASESDELEAFVVVTRDPKPVLGGRFSLRESPLAPDERGAGGPRIDRVCRRLGHLPSKVRFLPRLGAVMVKGDRRFLRELLVEQAVVSATTRDDSDFDLG